MLHDLGWYLEKSDHRKFDNICQNESSDLPKFRQETVFRESSTRPDLI